jgi:hypothetical protein
MSSKRFRIPLAIALVLGLVGTSVALAASRHHGHGPHSGTQFSAHLIGYSEVPAINTTGQADLTLTIGSGQLTFTLTYSGLSGNPGAAHVHIGQPGVNGNVSFFFCGGGGKPACPAATSGTITGTVLPADVGAIPTQGFNAGDLNAVISAIRGGVAYANMHTTNFPGGEIRGQLQPGHGHGHDDH